MSEFDLINRYFKPAMQRPDVILGIGDDCALLQPPQNSQLAMTADTLVAGVHFPANTAPGDLGYKCLAVNLSDLAAMGAEPAWAMLAITLPAADEHWLQAFMQGFFELARAHHVQLIGGDTTSGPLSITIQLTGFVSPGLALRRDAAKPGDRIYVSGTLGDAALGLQLVQGRLDARLPCCIERLNRPSPRVSLGRELIGISHCAIDVSDGLLADLGHIVSASQCSARIYLDDLPRSQELNSYFASAVDWHCLVAGGDDYELCFTVPLEQVQSIPDVARRCDVRLTCIGEITEGSGVHCLDSTGKEIEFNRRGYDHFG